MLDVEPIAKNVGIAFKYHPKYPWDDILSVVKKMYKHHIFLEGFPSRYNSEYKIK
jgi:hypothetical protein